MHLLSGLPSLLKCSHIIIDTWKHGEKYRYRLVKLQIHTEKTIMLTSKLEFQYLTIAVCTVNLAITPKNLRSLREHLSILILILPLIKRHSYRRNERVIHTRRNSDIVLSILISPDLSHISSPAEGRTYRIKAPQNLPRVEESPRDLCNQLVTQFDRRMAIDPLPCNVELNCFPSACGEVLEGHDLAGAADWICILAKIVPDPRYMLGN